MNYFFREGFQTASSPKTIQGKPLTAFLRVFFPALLVLGLSLLAQPVLALESAPAVTAQSRASLVTEEEVIAPDQGKFQLHAGLSLTLGQGWHTYWRNPGDAGEPPEIELKAQAVPFKGKSKALGTFKKVALWETPVRFKEAGLVTYGYEGEVLFPLDLSFDLPKDFKGNIALDLTASWLNCAKLCVPEKGKFKLSVPVGSETQTGPQKALFDRVRGLAPEKAPFETVLEGKNRLRLKGQAQGKKQAAGNTKEAYFYPYHSGILNGEESQIVQQNGADLILELTSDKTAPEGGDFAKQVEKNRLNGVIELVRNNGQKIYYEITPLLPAQHAQSPSPSAENQPQPQKAAFLSQGGIKLLLFAFLGGLLLNLMPCVFPVLAMKAFSLVKIGHKAQRESVFSALFYVLGTVSAFSFLGLLVLGLRQSGSVIGWGFQFQSPVFVTLVCWLLLMMALNLAGVFEIMPPAAAGRCHQGAGYMGDFTTGILAVIVASPCTAPFMGVALAGALATPGIGAVSIFIFLGLGLAFPYALLACWPPLGRFLPKPGAWMEVFKQILAFPLLAACVWLIWVVSRQGGRDFAALVLAGGLVLAFGGWAFGLFQKKSLQQGRAIFRWLGYGLLALCFGTAGGFLWVFAPEAGHKALTSFSAPYAAETGLSTSFTPEKFQALRNRGEPVFIDMSASWCITCLVNEKTTLHTEKGREVLKKAGATLMEGDWTNKDPNISAFLHLYQRDGVPLYVWFPRNWPKDKKGIVLPQLLTPKIFRETLR